MEWSTPSVFLIQSCSETMSVFSATSECWNNASEPELHGFIPQKNANQIETGGPWEDRLRQISLHHLATRFN